ncbi:hypothetical protein FRUB_09624 [Fimbriiglobus ruber]|uniref:Uncharacterized protein n=1 Tax=Fimbriiglobus ruber TaxID=1908690 RepID=A0A225CZV1_9BACT|nr:hypothetical protein FRUB_09624 [Fimbriiglobus ruber]
MPILAQANGGRAQIARKVRQSPCGDIDQEQMPVFIAPDDRPTAGVYV